MRNKSYERRQFMVVRHMYSNGLGNYLHIKSNPTQETMCWIVKEMEDVRKNLKI